MAETKTADGGGQVVINFPSQGRGVSKDSKPSSSSFLEGAWSNMPATTHVEVHRAEDSEIFQPAVKAVPLDCSSSPETSKFIGSSHKPPKIPTPYNEGLTRRRSLSRSVYSRSKSRFVEQASQINPSKLEDIGEATLREHFGASPLSRRSSFNRGSPNNRSTRSNEPNVPTTSKTSEEKDEDEEIYKMVKQIREKKKGKVLVKIELAVFVAMVVMLVASLTIDSLKKQVIWGLEVWNWCVVIMVIFSGMLVTKWFMHFVVFLIEKNCILQKKVLYFVHGLKKSVQVFIWLGLVFITWVLLFKHRATRSPFAMKILDIITWSIVSLLIGAFLWLVKTLFLKILASNFNFNNFFDRIHESIFHHYVLQTLSGRPVVEEYERNGLKTSTGHLTLKSARKGKAITEKIDMGKLHKIKQEKVSALTMRSLVEAVRTSRLPTFSDTLDQTVGMDEREQSDREIPREMEAVAVAYAIYKNVAKPGHDYIDEYDLRRFMIQEEVDLVLQLFEEAVETGRITRPALTNWVVRVYTSRISLAHSLNDTKTAVKQLNKLVTTILIVVMVVIWLLLLEIATMKVLMFLSTQIVTLAFVIGSTCKNLFESIVFVFVMHPFDVGDRCVVDGEPLLVEEMNLLTTVFLKFDNEKVFYPNAILSKKPISNYKRSPDMIEVIPFSIAFSTPLEKISHLKDRVAEYVHSNPQHWRKDHMVVVKEIENVNKLKMALYIMHTINFQDFIERIIRKDKLVVAIKEMFEELRIDYSLLPQAVHLSHLESETKTAGGEPQIMTK